jgi:hypothetical protein
MPDERRRRADVVLEPSYLEGLADKSIDEVRALHEECLEIETELSYVRRLAQARIDIVKAETDRRAAGGSIGDLIAALPQILADAPPRTEPAASRLTPRLAPSASIEWKRGLEHLITDATLVDLPTLSDEDLADALTRLRDLERETSQRRRALHDVIDVIEAQLSARHAADRA